MKLTEFIVPDNIVFNLEAADKWEVIGWLGEKLAETGHVACVSAFLDAVRDRENHCTTGIGNGVAIPHGKSQAVRETAVAVAKLARPVDWQAIDEQPVRLVFMLAVQDSDAADLHLKLLQQIAVKLMDDEIVAALHAAGDAGQLLDALAMEAKEY